MTGIPSKRILVLVSTAAALWAVGGQAIGVDFNAKWRSGLKPTGQTSSTMTLATNGSTEYRIVTPSSPTTMDTKAAEDLAMWLKEITGATFPVVKEGASFTSTGREISIGNTMLYALSGSANPGVDLGRDGYSIAVKGNALFITGGKKRGIINGVYCLLEEDLGCRWYAQGTQTIPKRPTLKFRPVARIYRPILEDRRSPYYADAWQAEWSLRNKTYCSGGPVPPEWGGFPRIWGFVHTFDALVPPAQYFAEHPEYYSEIEGKRQPFQLCMTNPDVLKIITDKVRDALKADPSIEFFEVSPNDRMDYCECANCKKINDSEGTYMGALLQFINKVADSIKDDYPNTKINTLAYLGTIVPPKTIKPRPNVSFWLCTDSYAWTRPNDYAWEVPKFATSMGRWGKMKANMIIWDYPSNFAYMTPNINIPVVAENLRYYIRNGATGVMFQCAHDVNFGADHSFMRSWVWAKQLWDPSRDTRALIRDFNYGYYGVAGQYMQEYDDMLWNAWKLYRRHRRDKSPLNPVDEAFVNKAWVLVKQAESVAAGDPDLTKRIKIAQMPLMYMKAAHGVGKDRAAYRALLDDFEATARTAGARYIENAFQGPDIDRQFDYWRKVAATDPDKIGVSELNNEWRFTPDAKNIGMSAKWFAADFDDSSWAKVRSDKGNGWESQGFRGHHGLGWYRQALDVPEQVLAHEGLKMVFLAVDEEAEVFINGERAFDHTVASTGLPVETLWTRTFMFDAKPLLHTGRNEIAVRVHDTVGMAGIWKPVYLAWGEGLDPLTFENVIKSKRKPPK